ncbi:MAG: hypothetical protein COU71_00395 [Parcubacteria group bacterium CG10_big_fil_rev_8_21_14_0_10_38_31]|nr:MAG: hypothetical protein COU71_00395 [Parcubacteria group bacterium CG10_big_fil_rev_8_21_14_0_10_38_31]
MKPKNFSTGNYYHIYTRGTEKRKIFIDKQDYQRFLILLHLCNNSEPVDIRALFRKGLTFAEIMNIKKEAPLVDIGAYCLMTNHIHLLIKSKDADGIPRFMQKLCTAYTMYFNKKYKRTGRLFESTFKSNFIDSDEYLKYMFAYIHLNPIKLIDLHWKEKGVKNLEEAKKFLNNYLWSSYSSYIDNQNNSILDKREFPRYFNTKKEFDDFIDDWLLFAKV